MFKKDFVCLVSVGKGIHSSVIPWYLVVPTVQLDGQSGLAWTPGHTLTTCRDPQGATCHLTPCWILLIMADKGEVSVVWIFVLNKNK